MFVFQLICSEKTTTYFLFFIFSLNFKSYNIQKLHPVHQPYRTRLQNIMVLLSLSTSVLFDFNFFLNKFVIKSSTAEERVGVVCSSSSSSSSSRVIPYKSTEKNKMFF